jgi:hypothetical protein
VYLERAEKLAHQTVTERLVAVVRSKNASPTWTDIRTVLLDFDRADLRGLVQDLYTASKDNRAFLHARLGLGHDQLQPFKAKYFYLDMPRLDGQPIRVGLKSQEGDCGLQESDWSPIGDGGAVDILLRRGIRFSRILQHGK